MLAEIIEENMVFHQNEGEESEQVLLARDFEWRCSERVAVADRPVVKFKFSLQIEEPEFFIWGISFRRTQ